MLGDVQVRRLSGSEEISAVVEGRPCQVVLWNSAAELTVPFERSILPSGLRINESSLWGPPLQEAWISGEAVQTGDVEFDLAFVVLHEEPGTSPKVESAREISPALRACLLELRAEIRDADVFSNRLKVRMGCKSAGTAKVPSGQKHRFLWMVGATFLDFDRMPTGTDLRAGLEQALRLARTIERSSGSTS